MQVKKKTDQELVEEFREGNSAAFEELVSRYSNKAFSLATRLTRNQQDAEEVLQDVFVSVFRKLAGFEGKSSFSSWLYRVTVNASLMKLRKRRQDHSISIEELQPQVQNSLIMKTSERHEADNITSGNQLKSALEDAIRRLPEDYRPVFILRDIDGLTSREVSKILDLTVPAVKSRLHRSRLMLRRKLGRFYRDFNPLYSERTADQ